MTELANTFQAEIDAMRTELGSIPQEWADVPWRNGGWTRKQILGHLLDSAANNRQRFVRCAIDGKYAGPGYAQDHWVNAHGYVDQSWVTLLKWWDVEHDILAAVVKRIPESRLKAKCVVGDADPVTLRYLIEDYLHHQRWHLSQMFGKSPKA
ncbi:MAG: DinB family protein [Acidobacteriota bacterium]|nr:DinB family protein [Acidobacteriota bacterium]